MELHQVRYFLAVAEELNFSRAAEKCNVSQPALSRAVILLEEEFGGPLFHRERRLTNLSPLGRMVKPYLEQIWRESGDILRLAQQVAGKAAEEKHTLRLGIMTTIAPSQFTDLIMAVPRAHAGVNMMLSDANSLLKGRTKVWSRPSSASSSNFNGSGVRSKNGVSGAK